LSFDPCTTEAPQGRNQSGRIFLSPQLNQTTPRSKNRHPPAAVGLVNTCQPRHAEPGWPFFAYAPGCELGQQIIPFLCCTNKEGNLLVVGHASARKKQAHLNIPNPDGHFRSLPNAGLFLEADSRNTQTNQQEQMPTHPPLWSSPEQNIEGLPSALWQRKQLPTDIGTNCRGTKSNYELRYTPSFLCCQVSSSSRFVNFNQAQCSFNT
jgi:hypothetical protein